MLFSILHVRFGRNLPTGKIAVWGLLQGDKSAKSNCKQDGIRSNHCESAEKCSILPILCADKCNFGGLNKCRKVL